MRVEVSPEGVAGAVLDATSLGAEKLTFPGSEATPVNGYLARPAAPGEHPGMIVIHEAGGLNGHIRDVADRIASLGYVALAVDLYTREGGPPPAGDTDALMKRLFSMSDATVLGDLEGAADFLRAREDVTARVGCIGFCMGGRYTLLFAVSSDRLDAAVDCWGGFIDKATPQERSSPERPRLRSSSPRSCTARCWPPSAPRTRTPRRDRRAAARGRTRERQRGAGRHLRGRRACLLRRLPTDVPRRGGAQAVGTGRALPPAPPAERLRRPFI